MLFRTLFKYKFQISKRESGQVFICNKESISEGVSLTISPHVIMLARSRDTSYEGHQTTPDPGRSFATKMNTTTVRAQTRTPMLTCRVLRAPCMPMPMTFCSKTHTLHPQSPPALHTHTKLPPAPASRAHWFVDSLHLVLEPAVAT